MTIFLIGFLAVGSMQISAVNGNTSARMRTSASILAGDKDEDGVTLDDDGAGNLTTVASRQAIRTVEIILNASIGTTVMVAPHQMELRSEVKIRNLGLNP